MFPYLDAVRVGMGEDRCRETGRPWGDGGESAGEPTGLSASLTTVSLSSLLGSSVKGGEGEGEGDVVEGVLPMMTVVSCQK